MTWWSRKVKARKTSADEHRLHRPERAGDTAAEDDTRGLTKALTGDSAWARLLCDRPVMEPARHTKEL